MSKEEKDPCFSLFSKLLNEISHELRSPLSVISNDIAYWENCYGEESYQLSKRALNQSIQLLDTLDTLIPAEDLSQPISINQIKEALQPLSIKENTDNQVNCFISIFNSALIAAIKQMIEIFRPVSVNFDSGNKDYLLLEFDTASQPSLKNCPVEASESRISLNPSETRFKLLLAQTTLETLGAHCEFIESKLRIGLPLCKQVPQS